MWMVILLVKNCSFKRKRGLNNSTIIIIINESQETSFKVEREGSEVVKKKKNLVRSKCM